MYDILVKPDTEEVIAVISQDRWERKWAEILSMHCSPHDVWTAHGNWKYITMLPDKRIVPGSFKDDFPGSKVYRLRPGLYSFKNIHGINMVIEVDEDGRRLIRNHREYWKNYLVPHFFTDAQWEYVCNHHKEEYRQLFCKGRTYPHDVDPAKVVGEDRQVIRQCVKDLYKMFREDKELVEVIGKDYYGKVSRLDTWQWGSGDCSDFVPLRVDSRISKGAHLSLDFLSEETKVKALSKSAMIYPKYHKVVTEKVFV